MSVLVDNNTRLVVRGITGRRRILTRSCMEYGTNVVAGVTPGKGGQMFEGKVPVFDTVWEARQQAGCNVSVIFVPPRARRMEFSKRSMPVWNFVICITEGIPVMDMMRESANGWRFTPSYWAELPGNHHAGRLQDRDHARLHSQTRKRRRCLSAPEHLPTKQSGSSLRVGTANQPASASAAIRSAGCHISMR
jgi:hypothetical protein